MAAAELATSVRIALHLFVQLHFQRVASLDGWPKSLIAGQNAWRHLWERKLEIEAEGWGLTTMKFMINWKLAPGNHQPAGERFLKSGAPLPDGLRLVGRWHAPGSVCGWVLIEGDDLKALYEHVGQWANLLDCVVSPVLDDGDAAEALSKVYG